MNLTKHFSWAEFKCHCGCAMPPEVRDNIAALAEVLDRTLRSPTGRAVKITSGYRCPKHNAQIGGASQSKHCEGIAADIIVSGWTAKETKEFLEAMIRFRVTPEGGLGLYKNYPNMVHYDMRGTKARWEQ